MASMTPLDDALTERRPRLLTARAGRRRPIGAQPVTTETRTTRPEIWQAVSDDHRWAYLRAETPTTPWEVIYLPTGQETLFTNLPEARRWTASGRALPILRARAQDVIRRGGADTSSIRMLPGPGGLLRRADEDPRTVAERLGRARRAAMIFDGAVTSAQPVARCQRAGVLDCGGYLAEADDGRWVHADACPECVGSPVAERRRCRNLDAHLACGRPEPVDCGHARCGEPAQLTLVLCPRGQGRLLRVVLPVRVRRRPLMGIGEEPVACVRCLDWVPKIRTAWPVDGP